MKFRSMLSTMTVFGLLMSCIPLFAQIRIIPHVTSPSGGFTTRVIVTNLSEQAQDFQLIPYESDGIQLDRVDGMLEAEETVFFDIAALFPTGEVSHFSIGDNPDISVSIAYQDDEAANSEAHVGESNRQALRWRIYPGSLNDVLDGIAVVNNGTAPSEIFARQMTNDGLELARVTVDIIAVNEKALYLFEDFNKTPNTYFEIFGAQPMSLIALRFANGIPGANFFWATNAVALPGIKAENDIPQIIDQVPLSVVSGSDITLKLEDFTVIDDDNTYPDDFTLEVAAGNNYTFNGAIITPDQGFTGTLQVPIAVSDGLDSSPPFVVMIEVTAGQTADPRIGQKASFPSNNVYNIQGGVATIVDEKTIRIDNFTYSGQGPDVRIFLGKGGNYAGGFPISEKISGNGPFVDETLTLTIPDGKTLDDFDGISIWCTLFFQDFSSAIFQ